jgi:hypothetical protein
VSFRLARRRTSRRLRQLFGRRIGGFGSEPFALEGRSLIFYQSDPGGDACAFVTGLCQTILASTMGEGVRVVHSQCQARRDNQCRWTATAEALVRERESVGELLRGPEFEPG